MATVTLTDLFAQLNGWQGNLLWAGSNNGGTSASVTTTTATTFAYAFQQGHPFAGYSVTITGAGFTYDAGVPTDGTMRRIVITDAAGATVLNINGLGTNAFSSDLALFAAYEFGWTDPNGNGPGSQSSNVWALVLAGDDTINGTSGDDRRTLAGVNNGNDLFNMGDGRDQVNGTLGNDTIDGGNGFDVLNFEDTHYDGGTGMRHGITVDLVAGTVLDVWGFTDTVINVEGFIGSALADTFIGAADEDTFWGLRGADTFNGGGNLVNIARGNGGDWVRYENDQYFGATRGIVANLQTSAAGGVIRGTVRDGFGKLDTVIDIESVIGTRFNDSFTGSSQQNVFSGGAGRDSFDGAGGVDVVWFFEQTGDGQTHGVTVDLSRATGQVRDDGYGNVENLTSIENLVGTNYDDRLKGSAGSNSLEGFYGSDSLTGGGGADQFKYYWRPEHGQADTITDFTAAAGAERDKIQVWVSNWGVSNVLTLVNGTAATQATSTFLFDAASHRLSWDEDGTGAIAAIDIAVLLGVTSLTAQNFDLL